MGRELTLFSETCHSGSLPHLTPYLREADGLLVALAQFLLDSSVARRFLQESAQKSTISSNYGII